MITVQEPHPAEILKRTAPAGDPIGVSVQTSPVVPVIVAVPKSIILGHAPVSEGVMVPPVPLSGDPVGLVSGKADVPDNGITFADGA